MTSPALITASSSLSRCAVTAPTPSLPHPPLPFLFRRLVVADADTAYSLAGQLPFHFTVHLRVSRCQSEPRYILYLVNWRGVAVLGSSLALALLLLQWTRRSQAIKWS